MRNPTNRASNKASKVRAAPIRIEKVYWSLKHRAIAAKVFDGKSIKVYSAEALKNEPGELFVNYITCIIMQGVTAQENAKQRAEEKARSTK